MLDARQMQKDVKTSKALATEAKGLAMEAKGLADEAKGLATDAKGVADNARTRADNIGLKYNELADMHDRLVVLVNAMGTKLKNAQKDLYDLKGSARRRNSIA